MFFDAIRLLLVLYVLISPFVYVYLQQSVFKDSFDDSFGSRVIMRLHLITTLGCVAIFLLTFSWSAPLLLTNQK